MDRSVAFFRDVLTFELTSDVTTEPPRVRGVRMRLGDESLALSQYLDAPGRPMPEDSRSNDLWFQHAAIIVRDMPEAYARLQRFNVQPASAGPQRLPDWNEAAGGIRAFYFRDPDGHFLEILEFPPDKGNTKWHEPTDRLFLGIDHTAIVVADTDRSLAFFRDRLGLRVAGASKNYGPEQERLNNVPGAHLRITALRAASGPGIELLEYLTPRDGRPFPVDAESADIFHWHVDVRATDDGPEQLLRDPDGHVVRIVRSTIEE